MQDNILVFKGEKKMKRAQRVTAAGEPSAGTVETADGRRLRPETGYWRAGWALFSRKKN